MTTTTFDLIPTATLAAAPFTLGHAFKVGDVPAGSQIVAPFADFQSTPKTVWPDGSLKFAILAGRASVTSGVTLTSALSIGTPTGGTALTTTNLKATGVTASIGCGAFGTVSWATTDWDSPFEVWVSGPKMSSWIYRKAVGSDAHLVGWLEVRLYAGGEVEVLPWIENGYLKVAGATRKDALYTFTLGGTSRFSDYVGTVTAATYSSGATTFTMAYGGSTVSPLRVRSGSLLGTATWQSAGSGVNTYGVVWDTTAPGSVSTLSVLGLPHHARTVLISGTALAYWLGTDPGVTPSHNKAYFQASELVPTYMASSPAYDSGNPFLSSTPSTYASLITTFSPMAQGNFTYDSDAMPMAGYQSPIGLLPTHDVAYLVCTTQPALLYGAVVRNGFCAGRYGTHFRDETTQRPPAFSTYPTLVCYDDDTFKDTGSSTNSNFTAATSGGNPPQWDTAHCPSVGYMPYLVTGRFYFKEEVQFSATANHFHITDWVRGAGTGTPAYTPMATYTGASGICTSAIQTRTGAWMFRTLVQALSATPDSGDPLRSELITVVEENCRYFWQIYVAQANNPYGIIKGSGSEAYADVATDRLMVPGWMQDFVAMAWGFALCLGLPISSTAATRMAAYFAWKSKHAIQRLGTSSGFHYENAASYEYAASPSPTPDFIGGTGPWYANDAAVYAATYVNSQTPNSSTPNLLGVLSQSEVGTWGNLQGAISYAVRHGVPGALPARARMTSASNWNTFIAGFTQAPVWSIAPAFAGASTGVVPMPSIGPTIRVDIGDPVPGCIMVGNPGGGVLGSDVPSIGTSGQSILYASLNLPTDNNAEVRWTFVSGLTLGGSLKMGEAGETIYSGPADTAQVRLWENYAPVGYATLAFTDGATPTLVSSDLTCSYTLAALVSSDLSCSYALAALVRSDLQVVYSLLSSNVSVDVPTPSRTVLFEGGSRTVPFEGGKRTVSF